MATDADKIAGMNMATGIWDGIPPQENGQATLAGAMEVLEGAEDLSGVKPELRQALLASVKKAIENLQGSTQYEEVRDLIEEYEIFARKLKEAGATVNPEASLAPAQEQPAAGDQKQQGEMVDDRRIPPTVTYMGKEYDVKRDVDPASGKGNTYINTPEKPTRLLFDEKEEFHALPGYMVGSVSAPNPPGDPQGVLNANIEMLNKSSGIISDEEWKLDNSKPTLEAAMNMLKGADAEDLKKLTPELKNQLFAAASNPSAHSKTGDYTPQQYASFANALEQAGAVATSNQSKPAEAQEKKPAEPSTAQHTTGQEPDHAAQLAGFLGLSDEGRQKMDAIVAVAKTVLQSGTQLAIGNLHPQHGNELVASTARDGAASVVSGHSKA